MAMAATDRDAQRRDRADLYDLVREERFARDHQQWDRLEACYTADSRVRVTWFKGTGPEFAKASVTQARGRFSARHLTWPMDARIEGDRAVVESDSIIQIRAARDGVEFDLETSCRFLSWARRTEAGWKMVTFDCIYFKDTLTPVNLSERQPVDWAALAKSRPSYRFLDFLIGSSYPIAQDLPGADREETIDALYDEADAWLAGALDTPPMA